MVPLNYRCPKVPICHPYRSLCPLTNLPQHCCFLRAFYLGCDRLREWRRRNGVGLSPSACCLRLPTARHPCFPEIAPAPVMQSQAVITPGSVEREGIKLTWQPILASPPPTSMPHSVLSCHYPPPSAQPSLASHGSLRFYIVSQTHLPPSLFWPLPGWRLQPHLTHPIALW